MSNPAIVTTPDFQAAFYQNVLGRVATLVSIFARRTAGWTSTAIYGDVSSYLDTTQAQNTPVVLGTTYYIQSSSAEDGVGGSGARTVRVVYLDSAFETQTVVATLNGVAGVSLGDGIAYIQWMEIASGAAAAGSITISTVVGAPTVAQTVERIPPSETRSYSGRYKVPAGQTAFLVEWSSGAVTGTMDMIVQTTTFADGAVSTVFHPVDANYLVAGSRAQPQSLWYMRVPALTEIKISAIPGTATAGNRANAHVHILLLSSG